MERFGLRKSSGWHQQITATAAGRRPVVGPALNGEFPWNQLQRHTDQYLKRKGKLTPQERDVSLMALIENHPTKDIAIAACAHAMSLQAVRSLLRGPDIHSGSYRGPYSQLQAIVAVNYINPDAVSEPEAQSAVALMPFIVPSTTTNDRCDYPAAAVKTVLTLLIAGVPTDSLLHSHIYLLARRAGTDLATQLEALKLDSQWSRARAAVASFSVLSGRSLVLSPGNPALEEPLKSTFPNWRAWAVWSPSMDRLHLWEGFPRDRRVVLQDLLALEGPDFVDGGQPTLREGLVTQSSGFAVRRGNLHIKLKQGVASEVRDMLNRLSNALDAASKAGPSELDLLVHFCVGKPIDHDALQILEGVYLIADISISGDVLQVCTAHRKHWRAQKASIIRLLPFLDSPRREILRLHLAPYLIDCISNCMEGLQNELSEQLGANVLWSDMEMKLHAFGERLQRVLWLRPFFSSHSQTLINSWPTQQDIEDLRTLRIAVLRTAPEDVSSLTKIIDAYYLHCLTMTDSISLGTRRVVKALVCLWQQTPDPDRRAVALLVAQGSGRDTDTACYRLALLPNLPDDFVHRFRLIMQGHFQDEDITCVDLAHLLASTPSAEAVTCWRPMLYQMVRQRGSALLDYTLARLRVKAWLQWLADLDSIFHSILPQNPVSLPTILRPTLHEWVQRLTTYYLPIIESLEKALGSGPVVQCFLVGCEGPLPERLVQILDLLNEYSEGRYLPGMRAIVALLARDGHNAREVYEAMSLLVVATADGVSACTDVLGLHQETSTQVAEAVLSSWLQASDLETGDRHALEAVAGLLGMDLDVCGNQFVADWEPAAQYLNNEVAALLAEAQRLEILRVACKAADPDGTSALLASLQIEDPSPLDDAIANLPTGFIDIVEKVSEQEVELHIPLTHLTALQRVAMGVGNAQGLLVRLILGNHALPPGFCIHLDQPGVTTSTNSHTPWLVFDETVPDEPFCHGRANRATYQLARTLSRHLSQGFASLEKIHTLLTATLNDLNQCCMVCGMPQGVRLRRSTVCYAPECSEILTHASLEILLADIRQDPAVVDLLLAMLYAVARSGRLELLPGCPIDNSSELIRLLDELPPIGQLQSAEDLTATMRCLDYPVEALLTWVCTSYRGFLTSASGQLRIPNMPGVHQFVLANAAPHLENTFATQTGRQSTSAVFHGTSFERLYAILHQGLLVCSGGPLQVHGASYGNGIYMSEEPSTALRYSLPTTGWHSSAFRNVRVLLGCELAGTSMMPMNGMHVVPNAGSVMVRYIFLLPPITAAPLGAHLTPAMLSAFASLRSGAV
jgi:hypothetical protein